MNTNENFVKSIKPKRNKEPSKNKRNKGWQRTDKRKIGE